MRDPQKWVLNAKNYMRTHALKGSHKVKRRNDTPGSIYFEVPAKKVRESWKTQGFFDAPYIQTNVLGFDLARPLWVNLCFVTTDQVDTF